MLLEYRAWCNVMLSSNHRILLLQLYKEPALISCCLALSADRAASLFGRMAPGCAPDCWTAEAVSATWACDCSSRTSAAGAGLATSTGYSRCTGRRMVDARPQREEHFITAPRTLLSLPRMRSSTNASLHRPRFSLSSCTTTTSPTHTVAPWSC